MKRLFTIMLALILAISMVGCGSSSVGEVKEPASVAENAQQKEPSDVAADNTDNAQQNEQEEEPEKPENAEATISETVLVDEAGVKITAKSLEATWAGGAEIKLLIENNSGKNLTFQCRNSSVNGYMVDTMMSVDVADGKKANDSLTFMSSDMESCGIDTIADMEFSFHIYDEEWETYLDTDTIQIKTSIADSFEYTYDDSGELAYEGNGVKVVIKGLSEDGSFFGPGIVVYIENTGDKDVTVQVRDVSVNGFMVDPLFSCDVLAGKHAVDAITFMSSDLEENEITAIEDVELYFHIYDKDGWNTIVDTEVINITF